MISYFGFVIYTFNKKNVNNSIKCIAFKNLTFRVFFVACSSGFFGENCKENCSRYCFNNESCDYISGVCKRGCIDGYIGTHCNKCKKIIAHEVVKFISLCIDILMIFHLL